MLQYCQNDIELQSWVVGDVNIYGRKQLGYNAKCFKWWWWFHASYIYIYFFWCQTICHKTLKLNQNCEKLYYQSIAPWTFLCLTSSHFSIINFEPQMILILPRFCCWTRLINSMEQILQKQVTQELKVWPQGQTLLYP